MAGALLLAEKKRHGFHGSGHIGTEKVDRVHP
jgi:hypothetical protein